MTYCSGVPFPVLVVTRCEAEIRLRTVLPDWHPTLKAAKTHICLLEILGGLSRALNRKGLWILELI